MKMRLSLLVIIAVMAAACAAAPRQRPYYGGDTDNGAGTLTAARKYLEGRWNMLSYQVMPSGQAPIKIDGEGVLNYDGFGNMTIEVRVKPPQVELLDRAGLPSDNGVLSSNGRTVVDMKTHTLTFVLEDQPTFVPPSGPLAFNRPRHWDVKGNVLTLTTKDDRGKTVSVSTWQKMP